MVSSSLLLDLLCLLGVVVGIVGVVIPVLPGLLLCWASTLAWALLSNAGGGRWLVLGLVTLWTLLGIVVQIVWPGKRLKDAGVPTSTLIIGVAGALAGMVVIPVVGLPFGFVAGVWVAERIRLGDAAAAWPSTRQAVLGAGLSMLVELVAATAILGTLVAGMVVA
ncbi:MAG: uncharacterized protein QG622_1799 [Actinomycetota bacterium]|nr:uncharacterized protein [Actinomycetota bacterium]